MRQSLAVSVLWLLLGACWGGSTKPAQEPVVENKQSVVIAETPAPQTDSQRVMAMMEHYERALCACADAACVQTVTDDMTKWSQAEAAKQTDPPKMSEAEQKRATEIGMHMGECMQKAMSSGQP